MTPDEVKAVAKPALRHRLLLRPEVELEGVTAEDVTFVEVLHRTNRLPLENVNFVLPLALMTSYPAMALTGRLDPSRFAGALALAAVFGVASRRLWLSAIARYTSAGG